MQILIFLHGNGPGSDWAACLQQGDSCQFIGPRSSLNFADIGGPSVFFGDETSMGAALTLNQCSRGVRENYYVFEVSSMVEAGEVIERMGLPQAQLIQRSAQNTHLEKVGAVLLRQGSRLGMPQWIFTGKAQSIQAIRKQLRDQRMPLSKPKTKAYWAEGKKGLD